MTEASFRGFWLFKDRICLLSVRSAQFSHRHPSEAAMSSERPSESTGSRTPPLNRGCYSSFPQGKCCLSFEKTRCEFDC